jgi:hypothetical protein
MVGIACRQFFATHVVLSVLGLGVDTSTTEKPAQRSVIGDAQSPAGSSCALVLNLGPTALKMLPGLLSGWVSFSMLVSPFRLMIKFSVVHFRADGSLALM